jgi:phosphoglucomutase
MSNLIKMGDKFDLGFGNDPDYDRHGIVSGGNLMNPNHYLATAISYLLTHRPKWSSFAKIGKTTVSSGIIDKVVAAHGRKLYETPVGFKWFVDGLLKGELAFAGEESAGATFLNQNGKTWTTDKDGFCMTLLAAEMMAKTEKAPHQLYKLIEAKHGASSYTRIDSQLTDGEKKKLEAAITRDFIGRKCGDKVVTKVTDKAPGNEASMGGIKMTLQDGSWFAMRPSGTEPKMKLYVESFSGPEFMDLLAKKAREIVFE